MQILEELILHDSNTLAACEAFAMRTRKWLTGGPLSVTVYGDATGEQRRTSASRTDWQIVKDFFVRNEDRYHVTFRFPSANPPVKDRVNCVNALLCNHAGQHRLRIDPQCKELIKDFEQVCWKTDSHGNSLAELGKSNPARTHASDAAGYTFHESFRCARRWGNGRDRCSSKRNRKRPPRGTPLRHGRKSTQAIGQFEAEERHQCGSMRGPGGVSLSRGN